MTTAGGCVVQYVVPLDAEGTTAGASAEVSSTGGTTDVPDPSGPESDSGLVECKSPTLLCDGVCVDPMRDADHCGGCGRACDGYDVCDRAECRDDCRNGLTACNRQCVDTETDPLNCGACGRACGEGQSCVDESCRAL